MAEFIRFIPSPNQQNVSRTTIISFTVLNDAYGAQINTLSVSISNVLAISNGSFVGGYTGNIASGVNKFVVGIYPKAPNFLPKASKIDIHIQIRDGYNNLVSSDYSFYTIGYGEVDPVIPSNPSFIRSCDLDRPFFPPTGLGLRFAKDRGTGTEIQLEWLDASPYNENNAVFYNAYVSTTRDQVFDGYPDFLVTDNTAKIGGLRPGDQYFFGIRAVEFNPSYITISGLKQYGIDLYKYPSTYLDGYVDKNATFIPSQSIVGFPEFGILLVGDELIRYSSRQFVPRGFIVATSGRGFAGSYAEAHWSGSLIRLYFGKEDNNTIKVQSIPTFQKPNYALTYVLPDGYGNDGYRDGYDGYAFHDGYLMYRQEPFDNITTSGKNNDESGNFDRFDYCGTYRALSPYNFMRGQCRGSYFGGAQVRFDADGVRHLVKEADVATHMFQREELLLESTGEPFVLARRMWTGIKCHCVMLRREHPDARCPTCFVGDTLINTKDGLVPIKDIKVGDEVLTTDGSYQRVYNVLKRNYDGYLNKIETHTTNPIFTTPEHPFLSLCDNKKEQDIVVKLLDKSWSFHIEDLGDELSIGSYNYVDNYNHRLDWVDAKDLNNKKWLVNKWNKEIYDIERMKIPDECLGKLYRKGDIEFKIDEDFLWVSGYFLINGSIATDGISISIKKEDTDVIDKICKLFKNYGYSSKINRSSKNRINILIEGMNLKYWFSNLFNNKYYDRKIPNKFMRLPNNKLSALLSGICRADVSIGEKEIFQNSKILALQLIEILHRLGKQPTLRITDTSPLVLSRTKKRECYFMSWEDNNEECDDRIEAMVMVKSNNKIPYSGIVYNLEVEKNHTYVVENVVVHNCFGTGFVQGFVQFFNPRRSDRRILVRIDPTADDVNIVDRGGLEPAYEPSAWTIAFPAIKDRDVLIRFNPDNTEEYRYEVLDVTRVRALFNQTGAQKFRLKRFPKTDIIYQIPILRDVSPRPGARETSASSAPGLRSHTHQIVVPENVNFLLYKGATLVSEGHNHIIYNGIVQNVLGHTHIIV